MSEVLKQKIRKDLSRWSRKLLLCIGLEDIGKQLVGEDKWQNLYPVWRDVEQDRTPDFDPDEVPEPDLQDITSADLSHIDPSETPDEEGGEEKNEILENFFHLLPYWYFINRAFGGQGLGLGAGNASEDLKNSTNPLLDAFDANQRLNSLLLFESLKQHYVQAGLQPVLQNSFNHLQNLPFLPSEISDPTKLANNSHQLSAGLKQNEALQLGLRGLSSSNQEDRDQPLDLTQKNKRTDRVGENRKQWSADLSSTRSLNATETKANKVSPRPNVRPGKGYTSQELEAALRDIQSGKLGTRRAAVIYGIPRSTLRNKVYKMGKDRSRPYFRQKNSATNIVEDVEEQSHTKNRIISGPNTHDLNEAASIKETAAQHNNLSVKLVLPHTSLPSIPSSHSQGSLLLDGHRLHEPGDSEEEDSLIKSEEEISHEKKVLKEWLRTKLSRQQPQQKSPSEHLSSASHNSAAEALSDSSDNSDVSRQDSRKEVILKIPSLINNKSSLSRVISRKKLKRGRTPRDVDSINSAQYSLPMMTSFGMESSATSTNPLGGKESPLDWKNLKVEDGNDSMDDGESEGKMSTIKHENSSGWDYGSKDLLSSTSVASNSTMGSNASEANGKKSRPKRGKYRNYDRDALLKAVRAVQNGEMSVHRAGSFYGVPHSTLEYKVKERHLLRRPKRKGTESPKPSHKSSPESSMSGSDPQVPRNTSGTPGQETNSLPLTADLRESLSRYLNIGQGVGSSVSSPGAGILSAGNGRPILSHGKNQEEIHSRENRIDNHSVGLGRGIISPFLNLFNLDDLIRQNLDSNSLLDLTKKS
ncbi:unnamed protein product [Allacma fusca]|uniref:HTH psq-type domain-containing protein n=1 Tax=Allacma fusca TaxID=39272 RepID=A0A8J2PDJ8_9HEXA|nr:unnamed protein product [Allacma fusca]